MLPTNKEYSLIVTSSSSQHVVVSFDSLLALSWFLLILALALLLMHDQLFLTEAYVVAVVVVDKWDLRVTSHVTRRILLQREVISRSFSSSLSSCNGEPSYEEHSL